MASLKESFGFREKWLKTLFKVLPDNPDLFKKSNLEDAQYLLGGVGERQVPAIQEWSEGIGLIQKRDDSFRFTELGELIRKYDPTLSEFGTSWVIHFSICVNNFEIKNKLWFYSHYANSIGVGSFDRSEVEGLFSQYISSESVLKNKVMSPLCETMRQSALGETLGIGNFSESSTKFDRRAPKDDQLHPAILAYMLYDWAQRSSRPGVNIAEFFSYGSVARFMALGEHQFNLYLQKIHDRYNKKILWVSFTAGLNSVSFEKNIPPLAILKTYYLEHIYGMDALEALKTATMETIVNDFALN